MKIDKFTLKNINIAQQQLIKYYDNNIQQEYMDDVLNLSNYLHKTCPYITFLCSGRIKSKYSSLEKVKRKIINQKASGKIYDIFGIKFIVYSYKNLTDENSLISACYDLESAILEYFNLYNKDIASISEKHKDYILSPKSSGYQALHNILTHRNKFYSEIQLRTFRMEEHQLNGDSSHFINYKSSRDLSNSDAIPNFLIFKNDKIIKLSDYKSKEKYIELINFANEQVKFYTSKKQPINSKYRRRSKTLKADRAGTIR